VLSLIGSCAFGATCGWLCGTVAKFPSAGRGAILAVFGSLLLTGSFVCLTQGLDRAIGFAGGATTFWVIHAVWQHSRSPSPTLHL
jgi:hypothetical protein